MHKVWLALAVFGFLSHAAWTEQAPQRPELWFPVGEHLTYKITCSLGTVGYSTVQSEWQEENGRQLLAIRVRSWSTNLWAKLFPMDIFMESVVDPETFLPLNFYIDMERRQKSNRTKERTTFDHEKKIAHWEDLLHGSQKDFAINADARDLVSLMFYLRGQTWDPYKCHSFLVADAKLHNLDITVNAREEVKLRGFGKVRCLNMLPVPDDGFGGILALLRKIEIWISDDQRCLLAKGTAKVIFNIRAIHIVLDKVEGPGDDSWSGVGHSAQDDEAVAEQASPD